VANKKDAENGMNFIAGGGWKKVNYKVKPKTRLGCILSLIFFTLALFLGLLSLGQGSAESMILSFVFFVLFVLAALFTFRISRIEPPEAREKMVPNDEGKPDCFY
jgi:fumarate reductase subunit C